MSKAFGLKRLIATVTGVMIAFSMIPFGVAHAAVNTITGIPVEMHENWFVQNSTASVVIDKETFDISDLKGDFTVDTDDETFTDEGTPNPSMDNGYDTAMMYKMRVGCIKPGAINPDKTYTGTLTVPVPTGYDAGSAVRIEAFTDYDYKDKSKVKAVDNSNGTVSFPITAKYWEYKINGEIYVGEFRCYACVEFKQKTNGGSSSKKTDTTVKAPEKGVVSKISNVKGAKAKVTVKKVSDATEYQIRYKVGSTKKWKTASSKTGSFKIKVAKGKKITVQARVANSAGYGKWGASKKFKTDKK